MLMHRLWPLAIALSLAATVSTVAQAAGAPSPDAVKLIDELGLSAAATPMAEHPDWKPSKIVIQLMPQLGIGTQQYREQLLRAAGDVELAFDETGGFVPSAELMAGADALIGVCTTPAMQNADVNLRWVHNYFVGMDHCQGLSAVQLSKVVFTNNKRLSGPAIAEHAMAMLLALSRNLPAYMHAQKEFKWSRAAGAKVSFGELKGKTILIVGLGGIGTEIAWRANGLGMRVIATRNSSRNGPKYVAYVGLSDELHKLAAEADVVVNALPLTEATRGIFNKEFFAAVKPGAIFLSVGRGKSTVTEDLIAAMQSGQIFGAGLDVTDPEPLPPSNTLWDQENIIITPHVSAAGADSIQRTMIISVENLRRYVAGEPLLNVVDMDKGY